MAIVWQDVVCGGHPVATFWRACGRLVVCGLPIAALAGIALRAPVCDVFLPLWVDCCVCVGVLRVSGACPWCCTQWPWGTHGLRWCLFVSLRASLALHGPPRAAMAAHGESMAPFGFFWDCLAPFCNLWAVVGLCGSTLACLVSVEQLGLRSSICRQPLGVAGLLLYPLVFFCPSWISIRLRFGPFWNCL